MSQNDNTPGTPDIPPDPIYAKSLSMPIFLAALAVLGATALAIVDDVWLRRPYIGIQAEWKDTYAAYLEDVQTVRRTEVNDILLSLDRFQALDAAVAAAAEASDEARRDVQRQVFNVDAELKAVLEAIKSPRSQIAAWNYKAEHAAAAEGQKDPSEAAGAREYLDSIERLKATEIEVSWMDRAPGDVEPTVARRETATVGALIDRMLELQGEKARLQQELGTVSAALSAAQKKRNEWLDANLDNLALILDNADDDAARRVAAKVSQVGAAQFLATSTTRLRPEQLAGLITATRDYSTGTIEQIHIPDTANWVDRCETCHLNARAPLPVTAENMGGNALFASHPDINGLLAKHDPARFGCSMCHNGNGVAITKAIDAHGLNKYWLHRLHPEENYEAGCVQCHVQDLVLTGGERVTQAKENYRAYGCWGCHKMTGYDDEPDEIREIAKRLSDIEAEVAGNVKRVDNLRAALNTVYDEDEERFNELAPANQAEIAALTMQIASLRTESDVLHRTLRDLYKEQKKVGPNLKDLRAKVRPEWLTPWVDNPRHWRPDTKMPVFRWADADETKDVAAFLWQAATDVAGDAAYGLPGVAMGDVAEGERVFKTVGCLSCHGIEEGGVKLGNDFAANLSNLGDKYNRETGLAYYVRWLENPRHRLAPYRADCARDLTPEGIEKALVFGRAHQTCPNCGHDLQWDNPTVMPSFRLSRTEAVNVASYLLSKSSDAAFEAAPWLTETERFQRGKRLVQHHGCAGCHEIGGLEAEQRIGTNLSDWGSKPMERLDFGHYTHDAKKGHFPIEDWISDKDREAGRDLRIFEEASDDYLGKWYNHRGFAMHKLAEPDIYDDSKNVDRATALRMPKFNLSGQEIFDISTLLMGSVSQATLPDSIKYNPDDRGQAIREGWWVVQKYNCQGCHQIEPGQVPDIEGVLRNVQGSLQGVTEIQASTPPSLVGTGFRTRPAWLATFLNDPSLGGGRERPQSVRKYLTTRMPTFMLTENEIGKLVRFFDAMARQPKTYQPPALQPLTPAEAQLAEAIFATENANCLQCHVLGDQLPNDETKAPNLSYADARLKPEWMARWIQNPLEMQPGTAMPALFKKQCPSCSKLWDNDQMNAQARAVLDRDECGNCGADLSRGRWVYDKPGLPGIDTYEGDHIELMIRYLQNL